MKVRAWQSKLSDDDVREILLSGEHITSADLARYYGVTDCAIYAIRSRQSYRALRLADELGLKRRAPRRTVWDSKGRAVAVPATHGRVRAPFMGARP